MGNQRLRPSSGVVAGFAASAVATLLAALLHTAAPAIAFPPQSIGQILIRTTPGALNSFFIGLFGHWALRLAVLGVAIGFAACGVVFGMLIGRWERIRGRLAIWGLALTPAWAAAVILYPEVPQYLPRVTFALATLPVFVVGGVAGGTIYRRLVSPSSTLEIAETEPHIPVTTTPRLPGNPPLSRRYFLMSLGVGGAGVALGLANIRGSADPGTRILRAGDIARAARPTPTPGDEIFEQVKGLTPDLTSIANHYVVDEEIIDPIIDPKTWRLSIAGLVDAPLDLGYEELKSLPAVERYQTLECVSNEVGGKLISTAKWVGVPLKIILEKAKVDTASAAEVVFRASGGYSDSLPIDHAMDESTLIAFGMNDHVLPRAHGFPARLLSLRTYGYKNPKWLTGIEVVERPYRGFWQQRGWNKEGLVKTMSRIDVPRRGNVSGRTTIAGVAFAADRGISKVEVSTDDGRTWSEARLKTPLSDHTWRLWLYEWDTDTGDHEIVVRAYDGTGEIQIADPASPFPSGSSGYDTVEVSS
jgi:DMSO/TMAO reductase YedYZ molybdopterin-dependent catalytic subunit